VVTRRVVLQRRRHLLACLLLVLMFLVPTGVLQAEPSSDAETSEQQSESDRLLEMALDHWLGREIRLQEMAQRIQIAGVDLCEDRLSPIMGATIVDLKDFQSNMEPKARKRFGAEHRYFVTAVFGDMPAARAGLQIGDAIVKFNGSKLKDTRNFYGFRWPSEEPVQIEVSRDGETIELAVSSIYGCRFPASVSFNDMVNAGAHGTHLKVNTALMRDLTDDDFLAYVVGHEVAHNIFPSRAASRRGGWASRGNEARADYVGAYLATIAGYRFVNVWEEGLGSMNVDFFNSRRLSHPSDPKRKLAQEKTIEEIRQKLERGEPLELRFE
jgi:hypothetical protein